MRWNKIWAKAKYRKTTHIENAELYSFLASGCISAHVSSHGPPSLQLCKKYVVVRAYYTWRWWPDGRECLATAVNSGAEILVLS